jgi:hypothetical protein
MFAPEDISPELPFVHLQLVRIEHHDDRRKCIDVEVINASGEPCGQVTWTILKPLTLTSNGELQDLLRTEDPKVASRHLQCTITPETNIAITLTGQVCPEKDDSGWQAQIEANGFPTDPDTRLIPLECVQWSLQEPQAMNGDRCLLPHKIAQYAKLGRGLSADKKEHYGTCLICRRRVKKYRDDISPLERTLSVALQTLEDAEDTPRAAASSNVLGLPHKLCSLLDLGPEKRGRKIELLDWVVLSRECSRKIQCYSGLNRTTEDWYTSS